MNNKKSPDDKIKLYLEWCALNESVSENINKHLDELKNFLLLACGENIPIYLMGSRRLQLAYPESDADIYVIYDNNATSLIENVMKFYGEKAQQRTTSTGLPQIIINDYPINDQNITLEVVIQKSERYELIRKVGNDEISKGSLNTSEQRAKYTCAIRKAYQCGDQEKMNKLKQWSKIFPEVKM